MNKAVSLILYLILLCSSCDSDIVRSSSILRLEIDPTVKNELSFSDIFEDLEYIFLKMPEVETIGRVSKIDIKNDKIFVSDVQNNALYIFDKLGNHQVTVNNYGKGKGEYTGISDFQFDPNSEIIYIMNRTQKKMIRLKSNGEFIDEFPLPKGFYSKFHLMKEDQLVLFAGNDWSSRYNYKIIDSRTGELRKEFMKIDENKSYFLHFITYSNFYTDNNEELYTYQIGDEGRVYHITSDSIQLGLKIDFGEYSVPSKITNGNHKDVREFVESINDQYAFRISNLFETNQYFLFTFTYLENYLQCIYNKFSKEYFLIPKMTNDIRTDISISDRGPYVQNTFKGVYNDKVYGILNLDAILFHSKSQTIDNKRFDENSNPVIYIGKLKETINSKDPLK